MKQKPKIAILYPAFMGGGAEAVCLWILEALKEEYDLSLLTFTDPNWESLNNLYGTRLSSQAVKTICPFPKWSTPFLTYLWGTFSPMHPWRQHIIMRYFKRVQNQFDLAISGYNEMDLGKPGIQYVHSPKFALGWRRHALISGFSPERMKQNITLACSKFVADSVRKNHGISARVVYPPVVSDYPEIPWESKENAFICCGRMAPEKQLHKSIDLLNHLRAQGHDISLNIIGTAVNKQYVTKLETLQRQHHTWIKLYKSPSRKEYNRLLAQSKFAIHLRKEGFGIAIAEMIQAGCLPFVHSAGGQTEIINDISSIKFANEQEAIRKISTVLKDDRLQSEIRKQIQENVKQFSCKAFQEQIVHVVSNYFQTKRSKQV